MSLRKQNTQVLTIALAVFGACVLTLAGCAANTEAKTGDGEQVLVKTVTREDGSTVECVFWVPVDSNGFAEATGAQMSCNWDAVNDPSLGVASSQEDE